MPVSQNFRQLVAAVKAIFNAKTKPSKIVPFQTKITHRKLHIPQRQELEMEQYHQQHSTSDILVD